ncbi:MAG: DUF192 domain-containing protein [Spiribacter salinus]|uniref:DUF192 domain-containing protein n=1 Tax=Spiribacter salinus TaxID=1335746 RepID=A0A540VSW8_9GAMM|nr:MAG: DUF192 domain-containing protein [Spiribacter salinus]
MPIVKSGESTFVRTRGGSTFAHEVRVARSFLSRLVGLLGTDRLLDGHGLLIQPGGGIHTVGMKYAIDVMFLDAENTVLGIAAHVAPNRVRVAPRGCASVLELNAGSTLRHGLVPGEQIEFGDCPVGGSREKGACNEC